MVKIVDCIGAELDKIFKIADKWNCIFLHVYHVTKKEGR